MVSLLDIAPLSQSVPIGNQSVDVYGISGESFVAIIQRFPEVEMLLVGQGSKIKPEQILKLLPEAIYAIIARGQFNPEGEPDTEVLAKLEKKARSLVPEYQIDLVLAIIKLTVPSGPGPFVEKLTSMMPDKAASDINEVIATGGKVPDTRLPKA